MVIARLVSQRLWAMLSDWQVLSGRLSIIYKRCGVDNVALAK